MTGLGFPPSYDADARADSAGGSALIVTACP